MDREAVAVKDRIARSVFWITWSRGVVQLLSFLSTLAVARLLSPADYGLMALFAMCTYPLALLAELGLGAAIVQFRELDQRELNLCFWLSVAVAGAGYAAVYAAAPALAAWFGSPALSDILRVAGLSLPVVAVRVVPESLLRKRLELDRVSQAEIAATLATLPVVLGMAAAGAGVWALVAGSLLMPVVQGGVIFRFVRWRPGLGLGSERLQPILGYGLATLGTRVGWAAYQQLDAFVLGKVSGDVVLGFYSMAKQLATLAVDKVSVVVNQLASPLMAELQADRGAMRISLLRGVRLAGCLAIPLSAGTALVAGDLVRVALTEKWLPMVPVLQVLCLFALIRSIDVLLPPVLFARYRAGFLFWWVGSVLLVMPPALWAGARLMGALGVALASLVVYPFLMVWMAREALRELEASWRMVWEQLRPVVLAVVVMAGAVLLVRWAVPVSGVWDRLLRLAVATGVGALAYGGTLAWRGGPLMGELVEVARWLLRPGVRVDGQREASSCDVVSR